jgi:hypothetical protein
MIITEKTRSGIQIHLNSASLSQVNGMWQAFLGAGNLIRNCKAKESIFFERGKLYCKSRKSHRGNTTSLVTSPDLCATPHTAKLEK